jgi:hypothetical protein
MKKKLGLAIATLGTALTLLTPATAMARDRDDWGRSRGHERRERHKEHWEHHDRGYRGGYYYSAPSYYGYGYYNQAPRGYYDRWGCYHSY